MQINHLTSPPERGGLPPPSLGWGVDGGGVSGAFPGDRPGSGNPLVPAGGEGTAVSDAAAGSKPSRSASSAYRPYFSLSMVRMVAASPGRPARDASSARESWSVTNARLADLGFEFLGSIQGQQAPGPLLRVVRLENPGHLFPVVHGRDLVAGIDRLGCERIE